MKFRYFIEVSYRGTRYAGFQVQDNAVTVQEEVEKALAVFLRKKVELTGSSRTDTGVHASQNYFHMDVEEEISGGAAYNINALLPPDIAVNSIKKVREAAHCRFDALSRKYRYTVYARKNPFLIDRAYYFPYTLDMGLMSQAAVALMEYSDFTSFAKRNSQVKTFNCTISESRWSMQEGSSCYEVRANRFLRGMVRGLTGTMLQVGRKKISMEQFRQIIEGRDSSKVDFSVPGYGLCLEQVEFAAGYFEKEEA